MPLSALCAVLLAALCHAIWNLEAKRAVAAQNFVWLYSAASLLVWGPVVGWVLSHGQAHMHWPQYLALAGTAVLHLLYSLALQAGYRAADLSLVYPIARGTGPVLSFFGAVLILGETPGPTAILGLVLIVLGIVLVANLHRKLKHGALPGVRWGVITGACIAAYTLNDGWAVKVLALSPFLIDITGNVFRVIVLAPQALRDRQALKLEWQNYQRPIWAVAVLGSLGYLLVLFAMRTAPVSHVAPARELATLVGTWFGAKLLGEEAAAQRLIGALCIVAGVISLAFAG